MAIFNLTWSNVALLGNSNVTGQRAEYRRKTTGGSFISAGFSPINDLPTSAIEASSPVLADNVVFEFKVSSLCTVGGPTINDNGVREAIKFVCPVTTATATDSTVTVSVTGLPVDITQVIFNRGTGAVPKTVSGGSASHTFVGLSHSTIYTITTQVVAVVNGGEVTSALSCNTSATTSAPSACTAPQNLVVLPSSAS